MSTAKMALGSRQTLTTSALNSLASATYVVAGTITWNSASKVPLSSKLEVEVTPGTVASNKQVVVFAKASMDGSNFTSGPESSNSATDEPNLIFVGVVPCNTNATLQRGQFDMASVFGGTLPHSCKIIIKNETGVALAASGHAVYFTDIVGDVV
jgi:hypothetical protein